MRANHRTTKIDSMALSNIILRAMQEGVVRWAGNAQMRNELGNVHIQLGSLSSARESYEVSKRDGKRV